MAMGLLGAIGASVAGGIQDRQAQQQQVDLAMLERQLDLELAQIQRDWKKEDMAEARDFERTRMEEIQSGLPTGVYATPSDVRISDTRRRAAGGGGGTRKFDPIHKERLKYLENVMEEQRAIYDDPAATKDQRDAALKNWTTAKQEHDGIWAQYRTAEMTSGGDTEAGGGTGFDLEAIFQKYGVGAKAAEGAKGARTADTKPKTEHGLPERWTGVNFKDRMAKHREQAAARAAAETEARRTSNVERRAAESGIPEQWMR